MHKMPRWYREEMNRTEILPCGLTCVKVNMERIEAMLINKIELKKENVRPKKKKKIRYDQIIRYSCVQI